MTTIVITERNPATGIKTEIARYKATKKYPHGRRATSKRWKVRKVKTNGEA